MMSNVGVSQNTASAKATEIMCMFDLIQMHPEWTLPSLIDRNPLVLAPAHHVGATNIFVIPTAR
jgi:hypothetical protein